MTTVSVSIPADLVPFVHAELASGAFRDEADLIAKALRPNREFKTCPTQLYADVE